MNMILLFPDDFASDGTARLTGRRARHVHEVHRARVGDSLTVGRVSGRVGTGAVLFVEPDDVRLSVCLSEDPPPPTGLDLLLAMPRPKVLRRVLQSAASLGARRIVLVNAQRVEKSYFDTPFLERGEIERNLVLGLEQARDTALPEVVVRKLFRPFVEDELEAFWPRATCTRLLAHPAAAHGLEGCDLGKAGSATVLAVGPEGGWIPFELELLEANGFRSFGLGPRVLRVETAVPFAFGQVQLLRARSAGEGSDPGGLAPEPFPAGSVRRESGAGRLR
ncbi:MAG: 16S rRNA (uracil(1498)-N(3))-methyltransferase [Holophagales bacterium]|nr:16S rRNA (uracil(1498)-N(3))-methyltransferase [Holophagales bacterium]